MSTENEQDNLVDLLDKTENDGTGGSADGNVPADRIPLAGEEDVNIPDDELTNYIQKVFKNDITDKEEMGWTEKRRYDLRAYHGIKDEFMMMNPWPNASAHPVAITPVQLDTGLSMIQDLKWRNDSKVTTVSPVSDEDAKNSKLLEWLLNWQCLNDIPSMELEDQASDFTALLHGTAYEKVIREYSDNYRLGVYNVPIENIYLPIDSKSPDINDTDRVTQLIPWSENDLRMRALSGRYRNLNKVGKGFVPRTMTPEMLGRLDQEISGLSTMQKISRDTWYAAEIYFTYYPRGSSKSVELIVTFSPATGAILRKIKNVDGMRPFVDKYYYPNYGHAFHYSMPEKLRNTQEMANYIHKQKTDGRDKAMNPAGFYEGTSGFDPKMSLRSPTAMHKVKNLGTIQWEPVQFAGIMECTQELRELKLEAEAITGFTDLQQGQYSRTSSHTLGQDQMRSTKADIRFTAVKKLVKYHWKRKLDLIYRYDDRYMPKSTKVKVLGTNKYDTIEKLFPREQGLPNNGSVFGMTGQMDFDIANKTIEEQMQDDNKRSMLMDLVLADPAYAQDKGVRYRAYEAKFEANGQFDFESIVPRPKEAGVLTPDEVIEKLMDGEQVDPDVNSNIEDVITAIEMFMRTGNFKDVQDPQVKFAFGRFMTLAETMRQQQSQAFNDHQRISEMMVPANIPGQGALGSNPSGPGQGVSAPPPPPVPAIPQGGMRR